MKKVRALLNGISVRLNVPETLQEFRDGARFSEGKLAENEGYLFNFGKSMQIVMENSGVHHDLAILYFYPFSKYGIVEEVKSMKDNSPDSVCSAGFYQVSVEMRQDFIEKNGIYKGAILALNKPLNI